MDPTVAFDMILSKLQQNDLDATEEPIDSLTEWLDKGGFPPVVTKDQGKDYHIARAVCAYVKTLIAARDIQRYYAT